MLNPLILRDLRESRTVACRGTRREPVVKLRREYSAEADRWYQLARR